MRSSASTTPPTVSPGMRETLAVAEADGDDDRVVLGEQSRPDRRPVPTVDARAANRAPARSTSATSSATVSRGRRHGTMPWSPRPPARLVGVEEGHADAGAPQLGGARQPGRPGADDRDASRPSTAPGSKKARARRRERLDRRVAGGGRSRRAGRGRCGRRHPRTGARPGRRRRRCRRAGSRSRIVRARPRGCRWRSCG